MIVFDLKCAKDHVFEAWFRDNATFDKQCSGKEISCPVCGERTIRKAPMAPNIAVGAGETGKAELRSAADNDMTEKIMRTCRALRETVEKNSDYVGTRFAEEARRIHYGETEKRSIYGEASDEDAQELHEEGVPIKAIPWVPRTDS